MYRLMIKPHNITNKKYLCVTIRKKWEEYTGSGIAWNRHLIKYGYNFSTELLFETEDFEEFCKVSLVTSVSLNVVLSEEFANLIPENGGDYKNNFVLFWEYASDEIKNEIYRRRKTTLLKTYEKNGGVSEETKKKLSFSHIKQLVKVKCKRKKRSN